MGEERNNSTEEGFEESLRQILDGAPSEDRGGNADKPPRPRPRYEGVTPEALRKAETESKALFWFKLMRPLAFLALLALFVKFVMRITAAR